MKVERSIAVSVRKDCRKAVLTVGAHSNYAVELAPCTVLWVGCKLHT